MVGAAVHAHPAEDDVGRRLLQPLSQQQPGEGVCDQVEGAVIRSYVRTVAVAFGGRQHREQLVASVGGPRPPHTWQVSEPGSMRVFRLRDRLVVVIVPRRDPAGSLQPQRGRYQQPRGEDATSGDRRLGHRDVEPAGGGQHVDEGAPAYRPQNSAPAIDDALASTINRAAVSGGIGSVPGLRAIRARVDRAVRASMTASRAKVANGRVGTAISP